MSETVDFDLHGYVGIRLLDARPGDIATVVRQLGPLQAKLTREPDITVRFTDEIPVAGTITYVGLHDAGFDEDAFFLLRGKGNVPGKARIPLAAVGGRCDIVCERRMPAVPLLLAIVNTTALQKGLLPLHASAFVHHGRGVLATGWAKGGKTEALLAFAARGARYIGDEWVYVAPDRTIYGIPEPIRLWRWQLDQLPRIRRRIPRAQLVKLGLLDVPARTAERAAELRAPAPLASILRRAAPLLRRQVNVQVPPATLFGADSLALRGRLDAVFLVANHDDPRLRIDPIPGETVARRMLASLEDERAPFLQYYRQFRFAFPDLRSRAVEEASAIEERLMAEAFDGLDCTWLRHPYPVDIKSLVEPIEAVLAGRRPCSSTAAVPSGPTGA